MKEKMKQILSLMLSMIMVTFSGTNAFANNTEFAQVKRVIAGVGKDIVKISHNPSLTLMQEPIHRNTSIAYYFYDEDGNEVE